MNRSNRHLEILDFPELLAPFPSLTISLLSLLGHLKISAGLRFQWMWLPLVARHMWEYRTLCTGTRYQVPWDPAEGKEEEERGKDRVLLQSSPWGLSRECLPSLLLSLQESPWMLIVKSPWKLEPSFVLSLGLSQKALRISWVSAGPEFSYILAFTFNSCCSKSFVWRSWVSHLKVSKFQKVVSVAYWFQCPFNGS